MDILLTQDDLFLDTSNRSCSNGHIDVLDVTNLTPVKIYTLTDHDYVEATNPITLDLNGRPHDSYFTESLVYCRLYDANNAFVRDWYGSRTNPIATNDTIVTTIASLKVADPSLGSITVIGYWTDTDCEPRSYVWDSGNTYSPDGGQVIESSVDSSGNWVLATSKAYMPSTYYGVYPGHTENIQQFLRRVNKVGTFLFPTSNYFVNGTYDTDATLSTSHSILLDRGCSFTQAFSAPSFRLIGNQTSEKAIGKLLSPGPVRSSWYESLDDMFASGSSDMTIDAAKIMSKDVELTNVAIHGEHHMTYTWTGTLTLNDCYIDDGVFTGQEKLKFLNMGFSDRYFYAENDFGLVNIQASSVAPIRTFKSPDMYITALEAFTDDTVYWLEGRVLTSSHTLTKATELHDVRANTTLVFTKSCSVYDSDINIVNSNSASDITISFTDSHIKNLYGSNSYVSYRLTNTAIDVIEQSVFLKSLTCSNSTISTGTIDTAYTTITAKDSTILADLNYTSVSTSAYVQASNTTFDTAILANSDLSGCTLNYVSIWPYSVSSERHMDLRLVNCNITTLNWDDTWQQNALTLDLSGTVIAHHNMPSAGTTENPYFKSASVVNGDRLTGITLKQSDFTLSDDGTTATSKELTAITDYITPGLTRRADVVSTPLIAHNDYSVTYSVNSVVKFATSSTWTFTITITRAVYDDLVELRLI